MRPYPKNWLLISAIALTTWHRGGGVLVMNVSASGSSNGTQRNESEKECSDTGLLGKLEHLSAWRKRIFNDASLEDVLLHHDTANLSYVDRLELVNRVMVDVLLQAIPDNSSPRNATLPESPLLAPRKGPAYRRRTTVDQNPSFMQENPSSMQENPSPMKKQSELMSVDAENKTDSHVLDEATESAGLANESSNVLNGEAHIIGISQPLLARPMILMFPTSEMAKDNKSVEDENQEDIQGLETVINDHERSTAKSEDIVASEHVEPLSTDQNISVSSQERPQTIIVKTTPPLVARYSSYLSVFGKIAPRGGKQNFSAPAPVNTVHSERFHGDGLGSSLTAPVKFNSSGAVNVNGNGALANLPRDEASLEGKQMGDFGNEKFGSLSTKNRLEIPEIGRPELQFPGSSINRFTTEKNNMIDIPVNISVQLNVSNLEVANANNCLMRFFLNMDKFQSNLTLTRANLEACMTPREQGMNLHVSVEWLKQLLRKILRYFESYTGSTSRVLPPRNNFRNVTHGSRAVLFPTPAEILSTQSTLFYETNHTHPQETAGGENNNSSVYFQEENLLLNTSENGAGTQTGNSTSPQNVIISPSRQPKMVSSDMILQEINARTNHSNDASDGVILTNYSQGSSHEGGRNTSACALQTRWSKVEHLRRSVELLLLSVPVSLKEMMEASSHPFLEDFIFRPEGRSIFAVTRNCAECYMKDPLGRCREVLFCKNGASVSSRILG